MTQAFQPQATRVTGAVISLGDEAKFARLYQENRAQVRWEIRRRAHNISQEDLQDLEQDVWRAAWRGLARFEARASFSTWLISITRHIVFSWLRHQRVREVAETKLAEWGDPEDLTAGPEGSSDPLARIGVSEALADLDRRFAEVIRLRYFEQLSDFEAAERLALPLGTVKRRIRSGLRHLSEALE